MAPIVADLTEWVAPLHAVVAAGRDHGATSFGTSALRLAPLVRKHHLGVVAGRFPDLLPRYERTCMETSPAPITWRRWRGA